VLFISRHNKKHICTRLRGGPVQMCFSFFYNLISSKYPKFLFYML
jgi:hypothetical protein